MTEIELVNALDNASENQMAWHKARNPALKPQRLSDYASGFGDGWRAAVSYLRMHGGLPPIKPS